MSRKAAPIRILLVENTEDDVAAFARSVQKEEMFYDIVSYRSTDEAMKRLHHDPESFDVVVVNYVLEGTTGLDFFKELHLNKPLPVILLADTGFEKKVAEALMAGFGGYLMKDAKRGYLNLVPSVLPRVLQQHRDRLRHKQIEKELMMVHSLQERTLKFTEALLTAIPTPVFYKDRKGRYLGCNRAFTEIMGVSSKQMRGKTVFEVWSEDLSKVYHEKDMALMKNPVRQIYEFTIFDKTGSERSVIYAKDVFRDENNQVAGIVGAFTDITERKLAEEAKERMVRDLQEALAKVKQLSGLLPICAACKKIRDDKGYWNQIESYIREHSEAKFSHGLCPECATQLYPDIFNRQKETS